MYIYKTTNLVNDKIYIGQSIRKFSPNYFGSGTKIISAVKKYGKKNFQVEILEDNLTLESINDRERYWITYFDSTNDSIGYNICSGGQNGQTGWSAGLTKYNHPSLMKMSIKQSNRIRSPHSEETKQKMSEASKGKTKSLKHKLNLSKATKGRIPWNKGISHNVNDIPEVKAKLEEKVYSKRRGKTLEELYGTDKAVEIKEKIINEISKNWVDRYGHEKSELLKDRQRGKPSGMLGKIYIHKFEFEETIYKLINKEELSFYIEDGWIKGRPYGTRNRNKLN